MYPSQIADPTSKNNLRDTKTEINEALETQFGNTGKECTLSESHKQFVEDELDDIKIEMNENTDMTTVKMSFLSR